MTVEGGDTLEAKRKGSRFFCVRDKDAHPFTGKKTKGKEPPGKSAPTPTQ